MENLIPTHLLDQHITTWLHEDLPNIDYTGYVLGDATATARILCKSPGVLCGRPFVNRLFSRLECTITWHAKEGKSKMVEGE